MARAHPSQFGSDQEPNANPEEWRALRGQLVELLDQVESEYARSQASGEADLRGLADRMKALREQVRQGDVPQSGDRREQALRSVKRAIDRFEAPREDSFAPSQRDALESAINEIRNRQVPEPQLRLRGEAPAPQAAAPAVPRVDVGGRFEELGRSVGGISSRLERLETELKSQRPNAEAMREIADQVAQVSQVVELLARAVGETGQVRRLEEQITNLASLITREQRVDLSAVTQRLDDVSSTVERLAQLQVEHVSRESELPVQQQALRQSIEDSARSLYDRIELIEKNFLIAPGDVHRLMDEMAQVADAMRNPAPPHQLFALVEALNTRIEEIETGGREIRTLKGDMQRLTEEMAHVSDALRNPSPPAQLIGLVDGLNARITEIETGGREVRSLKGDMEAMRLQLLQKLDLSSLTQRLEDVSATVERVADQQARDRDDPAQAAAIRSGVQAIEKSIRAIYDRIDSLEQHASLQPEDLDKLTGGLARITEAMQNPEPPHQLVALVDALNARIGEIESRDSEVSGLRLDMRDLREAVVQAVEPRLAAVESQLFALNERVAEQRPIDSGVGQIEAQVRLLAARMDQTGEQISGLARLYSEPDYEELAERVANRASEAIVAQAGNAAVSDAALTEIETRVRELVVRMDQTGEQITGLARLYSENSVREEPDYDALARMVAERTSEMVGRAEATTPTYGFDPEGLRELEERLTRLIEASAASRPQESATDDLRPMYEGMRRVDERLERLEGVLSRLGRETMAPVAAVTPMASFTEPEPYSEPAYSPAPVSGKPRNDTMPVVPSEERPLVDPPFSDPGPARAALEERVPVRKMHPGLIDEPVEDDLPVTASMLGGAASRPEDERAELQSPPPAFDPANVEPPPRPTSSFDFGDSVFVSSETGSKAEASTATAEATGAPTSRNTFIEAARRAASRPPSKDANANSLISRALARFQPPPAAKKPEAPAKPAKPAKAAKPAKEKAKPAPAPKVEPMASTEPAADAAPAPVTGGPIVKVKQAPVPGSEPNESFLSKHRQPILLAASVVALSFLTINLINQRQAEEAAAGVATEGPQVEEADVGAAAMSATAPEIQEPVVNTASVPTRVIPIVDSLQTGSINPAPAQSFGPGNAAMPAMPTAFKATEDSTTTVAEPPVLDGPVKVELPPDTIGPADLRQAAADGDARAQFEVAAIYTEGRAVPQDLEAAATWYERAAAQGFAPAQYRLGNLYENGKGVSKDLEQARLWYQRAAEAGNRMSMHNLAALYAGGELGKQDFAAAAGWFEKAAGQGLTDSQFNLGMLYARGLGVSQNMEASYKWFALAAKSGDQDAAKARDDIARSLDADAVTRLGAELEAWKPSQVNLSANYAPIGTWSSTFDPGQVIDNPEVVIGVQTILNRLGYDVGTPDGVVGPKTAEAIKSFEAATGMSQVGAINPRLLAVLGSQPG